MRVWLLTWTMTAAASSLASEAAPPTPAEVADARKAAFRLSAATFHHMRTRIEAGTDVKPLAYSARALEAWARALPRLFPEGSRVEPTRARPEVFTQRADFEAKAAAYARAAGRLAELAEANDKAGFAAQWDATEKACAACHEKYRMPAPPPPEAKR
jgi:cytochrome c556